MESGAATSADNVAFMKILTTVFTRRLLRQFVRKTPPDLHALNFWLEIEALKSQSKQDQQAWQLSLLGIYNRFIKSSAQEPVSLLTAEQREHIAEDLGKRFDEKRLLEIQSSIFDTLKGKYFQPFTHSDEYKQYVRSLQDKVTKRSVQQAHEQSQQSFLRQSGGVAPGQSRLHVALDKDGRTLESLYEPLPRDMQLQTPNANAQQIGSRIFGPPPFGSLGDFTVSNEHMSAHIASTYPIFGEQGRQYGSPTADSIGMLQFPDCTLFAIADGCGWGEGSAHAAQLAVRSFLSYLASVRGDFTSVAKVGKYLLNGLNESHSTILQHHRSGIGTTTLLGGLLIKNADKQTMACYISIGDCKVFSVNIQSDWQVSELPNGKRSPTNLNDPGGRIGITDESNIQSSLPDTRNLYVGCVPVPANCGLMLMSDGVHDNFNPSALGKSPADVITSNTFASWSDVPEATAILEASKYRERALQKLLVDRSVQSMTDLTREVIAYCVETTRPAREVMEQGKRAPDGHGKMDHASIMVFRIQL